MKIPQTSEQKINHLRGSVSTSPLVRLKTAVPTIEKKVRERARYSGFHEAKHQWETHPIYTKLVFADVSWNLVLKT